MIKILIRRENNLYGFTPDFKTRGLGFRFRL